LEKNKAWTNVKKKEKSERNFQMKIKNTPTYENANIWVTLRKKNEMEGASSEWEGKEKALASEKEKEVVYEGAHLHSSIFF
jgi:hypothetical protein